MQFKILRKSPVLLMSMVCFLLLIYHFSYLYPITNNGFVVANVRPVAANVSGYITHLYVQNEEIVKNGQPLFTVFKRPYELAYLKAKADLGYAKAILQVLIKQTEKTTHLIQSQQEIYEKIRFDHAHYRAAFKDKAASAILVNTALKDKNAAWSNLKALELQKLLEADNIRAQTMKIKSLGAVMNNAKVDLNETTVYARNNGIIQNLFTTLGAPINRRVPIFSFIDTDSISIQANFNETDLRDVMPGNLVTIYSRTYFLSKVYHGVVVSRSWAANRQVTDRRSQEQVVTNSENNWLLLPQRLPVQIKLTDYDPVHYPLSIGSSAYVIIHTKHFTRKPVYPSKR